MVTQKACHGGAAFIQGVMRVITTISSTWAQSETIPSPSPVKSRLIEA